MHLVNAASGVLAELLGAAPRDTGIDLDVAEAWINPWGAAYGGYVAGGLAYAIEGQLSRDQSLATLTVQFLRPLRPGGASVVVHARQRGRRAALLHAAMTQDDAVIAEARAWSLGPGVVPVRPHEGTTPRWVTTHADAVSRPHIEGMSLTPTFISDFIEIREPVGNDAKALAWNEWIRLRGIEIPDDEHMPLPVLAVLADLGGAAAFRAVHQWFDEPCDVMSLDLNLHVVARPQGPWLAVDLGAEGAGCGRLATRARYWDGAGRAVATMSQQEFIVPRA